MMRKIDSIISAMHTTDGEGVKLSRFIGQPSLMNLDPFLLFDAFGSDEPSDYIGGFPAHPHRGFQTVTYMLAGKMRHKDNQGHEGVIGPGEVQWMNAGSGVIHSEIPEQTAGKMQGFQLWINLPAAEKMSIPAYQEYSQKEIPVERKSGSLINVISGQTADGTQGAVRNVVGNPLYLDIILTQQAIFEQPIENNHTCFIYVIMGEISLNDQQISQNKLGVVSNGSRVKIQNHTSSAARFLLLACAPIGEPIARHGPFVMNTKEEINQAIEDYNQGRF